MKKILCSLLAMAMLFSLAACGGGGSTSTPSPSLALPSPADPGGYDPNPTTQGSGEETTANTPDGPQYGGVVRIIDVGSNGGTAVPFGLTWTVFVAKIFSVPWSEALVNFTQDGIYEPHLAESWDINEDEHLITFKLKEGIFFTDSSPLNAEAVAWNINMWREDGRGNEEIVEDAWAEDEYTVCIPYLNWQNVLFETFASHTYSIVSMQNYLDNGREYALNHPVGTGPFILDEWVPGSHVKFVRNDNYWMEGKPYLDGVEYYEITDIMTQNASMLSRGESAIDLFSSSNAEQAYTLISSGADRTPAVFTEPRSNRAGGYPYQHRHSNSGGWLHALC